MPKKKRIIISHNWKLLVIIAIVLVLLIVLVAFTSKQGNTDAEKECSNDSDCVKQSTSCCSCNMGGEEACVSRKNASLIQENLKNCNENIMCIALYNCRDFSCSCVNGKCV